MPGFHSGTGAGCCTDFATLPSQRGPGLAQHILAALEDDMAEREILNLYTIARARSAGMNRVFHNRDYEWTGTLVNNCHIAGQFEDMHVVQIVEGVLTAGPASRH